MSRRDRFPHQQPIKGRPHAGFPPPDHEAEFARGLGPVPHPGFLEEMREARFGMGAPQHHLAVLEDRLDFQRQEIDGLLHDNQGLATVHVALKQNLEVADFELQRMGHYANSFDPEKDTQMREMHGKAMKLEMDLRAVDGMKAEHMQVRGDIKDLTVVKEDLMGRVGGMTKVLARANADLEQVPGMKAEIDFMRQELQRARNAIEYEKKGYVQNYENGQVMEKKLVAMARELEKLQGEISNKEKRTHAAAAVGNSGTTGYNPNYGSAEAGYAGNPYPMGYSINSVQAGAEIQMQYGPGYNSWGTYNKQ